ncbi:MAG: methionyl-tRNA formyltransferase [Reichenbachiella sp.]
MGTPEFAVPSLQILHENGQNVVAVVTAPDKPKGRGKVLQGTPVKEYADANGLTVLQPSNLKSPEFIAELRAFQADLQIVVAFRMLPEVVWNMPEKGTINLHASLLPQYRGAAPINWAVINGEKESGATTFFLQHEIDTGGIIDQIKEPISEEDTAGDLYIRLMNKGAKLILKTTKNIQANTVDVTPQIESSQLKAAPKIFKPTCEIRWDQPTENIRNFIRGLAPFPAAWTSWNGKVFKIFKGAASDRKLAVNVGEFQTDNKTYLSVKTMDGALDLLDLQVEGKKRMEIGDFLRGYKFD